MGWDSRVQCDSLFTLSGHKMIIVTVRFRTTVEGGRHQPIYPPHLSCMLCVSGRLFDCRVLVDGAPIPLGKTVNLNVDFINEALVSRYLKRGNAFTLKDFRIIGDGVVVDVGFDRA